MASIVICVPRYLCEKVCHECRRVHRAANQPPNPEPDTPKSIHPEVRPSSPVGRPADESDTEVERRSGSKNRHPTPVPEARDSRHHKAVPNYRPADRHNGNHLLISQPPAPAAAEPAEPAALRSFFPPPVAPLGADPGEADSRPRATHVRSSNSFKAVINWGEYGLRCSEPTRERPPIAAT